MKKLLRIHVRRLEGRTATRARISQRDRQARSGVYFAERPDVTQTFFAIGHLGGDLRDPDYAALEVAANILGEGFTSRLMSQIRTKLGYAYNIGASWAADYDHPGTFRIQGSTKSQSTVETLQAIRVELDKLRNEPVSRARTPGSQGLRAERLRLQFR